MKITDYPQITTLTANNVFVVDGPEGTKQIKAEDAPFALMNVANVVMHRQIFRGKNLGTSVTTEQKTAIQNGTFTDLWLGDYWVINGVNWRIADFDYWYYGGDTSFTNHHLVIIPDTNLYSAKMNDTSTTSGGYKGSAMYTTNLTNAKSTINSAFGDAVLTHREYITNTVTSGYPSNGEWVNSTVELPNELMIYGSYIYTPAGDGTIVVKRHTISNSQLALFSVAPQYIHVTPTGQRISYWLRDVVSDSRFSRVTEYGGINETAASLEYGVRPVFPIG